ncbi:hypothetical protein ERJ75_001138300 [Trypanosoma vivax]|nr:hypothetical protein ERJ75_001138300 [Trypanosoma vivax]
MPRSSADVWRAPAGSRCSPGTRSTGTQRWSTARTHGRKECSAAQGPAYALCRNRRRGAAAADGPVRVGAVPRQAMDSARRSFSPVRATATTREGAAMACRHTTRTRTKESHTCAQREEGEPEAGLCGVPATRKCLVPLLPNAHPRERQSAVAQAGLADREGEKTHQYAPAVGDAVIRMWIDGRVSLRWPAPTACNLKCTLGHGRAVTKQRTLN